MQAVKTTSISVWPTSVKTEYTQNDLVEDSESLIVAAGLLLGLSKKGPGEDRLTDFRNAYCRVEKVMKSFDANSSADENLF